jgi:hypothetical protein
MGKSAGKYRTISRVKWVNTQVSMYSIAEHYDPDGDKLSASTDPLEAFLTYRDEVRAGAVGALISGCSIELKEYWCCELALARLALPASALPQLATVFRSHRLPAKGADKTCSSFP